MAQQKARCQFAAGAGRSTLADHPALLLGESRVNMQGEGVDVAAERADNERHPLRHQAGDKHDIAAEPVELGDGDFTLGLLGRLQRGLQLRPAIERIGHDAERCSRMRRSGFDYSGLDWLRPNAPSMLERAPAQKLARARGAKNP
jgi:hypothetical protein